MLWLCLRFPLLPLEVFTRAGMHAQRPVIVTEKHRVLCHDALAGEHGVSPGISASTAQALCPGLLTLERRKVLFFARQRIVDFQHSRTQESARRRPARAGSALVSTYFLLEFTG